MKIKRNLYIFLLIIFSSSLHGQKDDLIQFSGVVRNLKYEPVENVHIINVHDKTGTTSNRRGMFSFIVHPSDSVVFTSVGYKNTLVIIPDTVLNGHYPRDVYMLNDTIQLAEVKIFPWKSYEEFKVAFMNLELPEQKEIERAYKNIALIQVQLNMDFEPDANLSFKNAMKQQYEKLYYAGQYPGISILNPLKWAEFFEAVKNGDFKRNNDD